MNETRWGEVPVGKRKVAHYQAPRVPEKRNVFKGQERGERD